MNIASISVLRDRLARGEISHEALVAQAIDGASNDAAKHVFTRLYGNAALAAARHADASQRAGVALPALAGLPVTVKDLYDVAGETTMAGSVVCESEPVATADAVAVGRLRTAGAAIVGKTNMTEFAFSGVGINTEVNKALASPPVVKRMQDFGMEPLGGTPEQFRAMARAEAKRWGEIIKAAGVKLD